MLLMQLYEIFNVEQMPRECQNLATSVNTHWAPLQLQQGGIQKLLLGMEAAV